MITQEFTITSLPTESDIIKNACLSCTTTAYNDEDGVDSWSGPGKLKIEQLRNNEVIQTIYSSDPYTFSYNNGSGVTINNDINSLAIGDIIRYSIYTPNANSIGLYVNTHCYKMGVKAITIKYTVSYVKSIN